MAPIILIADQRRLEWEDRLIFRCRVEWIRLPAGSVEPKEYFLGVFMLGFFMGYPGAGLRITRSERSFGRAFFRESLKKPGASRNLTMMEL